MQLRAASQAVDQAALIETLRDALRAVPDLDAAYLFGSRARGDARADSDVDVGLLYASAPPPTLAAQPYELQADLAERIGLAVQLVVLNSAPPDLLHRVLRDGILLIDANRSRRIAFEVRARNLYWDLKPILDEYRRARQ